MEKKSLAALAMAIVLSLTSASLASSSVGSTPGFEIIPLSLGLIVAVGILSYFKRRNK